MDSMEEQVEQVKEVKVEQVKEEQVEQVQEDQILMDFSNMFKSNRSPPLLSSKPTKCIDNPLADNTVCNVIPLNISITQEEMKLRRCLDIRRWYCLSRPQYQRTCGISSVVTVWNYLFSTLGVGLLPPVS